MGTPVSLIARPSVCGECGGDLPTAKATGRIRKFCSERCRRAASRHRAALPWPPAAPVGYPTDPRVVRQRMAEALVATMEGDMAAPPEDQLAQGLLELDWLVYRIAHLQRDLPRRLSGRAGQLAKRIADARRSLFPEAQA